MNKHTKWIDDSNKVFDQLFEVLLGKHNDYGSAPLFKISYEILSSQKFVSP